MDQHQLSEKALSGFADAARYDQHRPSYPPHAVATLLDAAGLSGVPRASLVDLAAGTGKFTELLAAREEGFNIVAVEPHPEMRQQLAHKSLPNVSVRDGLSTSLPAESGTVDAVFAAQAFHWFANEASLKEIHRVLKPGGLLGLVWNAEDYNQPRSHTPTTAWAQKLKEDLFSFDGAIDDHEPRYRHDEWRQVFESQLSSTPITAALVGKSNSLFSLPLGEKHIPWTVWLKKEELWERYRTLSHVGMQKGEQLEKTRASFDEALSSDDVERNDEGQIAVHGNTVVVWTSKIPE